jgi:hypothetical protein
MPSSQAAAAQSFTNYQTTSRDPVAAIFLFIL